MPDDPQAAALAERLGRYVADPRVIAAIAAVPRAGFVPGAPADAYADRALPIGAGQTISQPLVVARMLELLSVGPADRVLDVGTGSGWHAALLGRLGRRVWSVERVPELARFARAALSAAGVTNVTVIEGDGAGGLADHAPFDRVNVAAATPERALPALEAQLASERAPRGAGRGRPRRAATPARAPRGRRGGVAGDLRGGAVRAAGHPGGARAARRRRWRRRVSARPYPSAPSRSTITATACGLRSTST